MDDQDKPIFSEAKQRKLKRHLDRARQAAEKEAVNQEATANAQQEQDGAQHQADEQKASCDQDPSLNTPRPPSPPRNDETRYTLPKHDGNRYHPRRLRRHISRPMCEPDSPPPSPTWGQLGTVAGCRLAKIFFSIVDAIFSLIRTTWNGLSLRGLLQFWDLALQTGRLVFVLLGIFIAILTLSQVFPGSFNQALTTCSRTSLPILAPVCGAIKVALPEFTQDQSDNPGDGDHRLPQLSVYAGILGQIAVKVQKDVAYALTSTASLSNEELDELDSALNDATLLISDQLHQLDYQLNQLLITSSSDPGWWSGMLQFFYIEETNVNRVLRRIDDVKRIFDKAHKSRLKISDQLATGAGSINDLHKTLCSWEDQLNEYSTSEETNLKELQGRLKDHYSPSWFWGYLDQLEDPDALQAEIYALENQLRALWDAELRARYGCTGSNIAGIGTNQIRKALEHDGKELGEIRIKIVQLGSRLRRDRDWKMAELELINILDTYFQKIERLYL